MFIWTINLKSFEIFFEDTTGHQHFFMNYKLEKFWNHSISSPFSVALHMNYKLEKFWNSFGLTPLGYFKIMNYKLEKFWNNNQYQ